MTNGLLIVSDGEVPEGKKKKNWTSLYWTTSSGCWSNRNRNKERGQWVIWSPTKI